MKNIKIIVGSIPENSLQKKIALSIQKKFSDIANYSLVFINDLPFYNYEIENNDIPSVTKFHKEIKEADGIIILASEYNSSISAPLKNALDWLSRGEQSLNGKPVLVAGASPGALGTVRAQDHLKLILSHYAINGIVMPGASILINNAYQKLDENGIINDEESLKFLEDHLKNFNNWIEKIK